MIDSIIKAQIEEAARFLGAGGAFDAWVNEHHVFIVKREDKRFVILCQTCCSVIGIDEVRAFHPVNRHIEANVIREEEPDNRPKSTLDLLSNVTNYGKPE